MSADDRFAALGLELPPAPKPAGVYKPVVFIDGRAVRLGSRPTETGRDDDHRAVGADLDQQAGYDAARQTGLAILATLKANLGSLNRIKQVIKVLGMVNSTPDFYQHPAVINGCSELFSKVFGPEHGVGARSAVGMAALPGNIAVEIEVIFEYEERS